MPSTNGWAVGLPGGLGNPVVATVENSLAVIFSLITLWIPLIVATLAILLIVFIIRKLVRKAAT